MARRPAVLRAPASTVLPDSAVDLDWHLPGSPRGEVWRYGVVAPFQAAPGIAGVFLNIGRDYGPGVDFEVGNDALLFDDLSAIQAERAVAITRFEGGVNPNTDPPNQPCVYMKHFNLGGFVPFGATRPGGRPHPHAGTGFALNLAIAWPLHNNDLTVWEDAGGPPGRRACQGALSHSYWELHQLVYESGAMRVSRTERIALERLLPGWTMLNGALPVAMPDGDDLLTGMVGGRNGEGASAGVARWQCDERGWRLVSFVPVTKGDGSNQPSVVRDFDGSLLFSARGKRRDTENSIRVWRSRDGGRTWQQTIDLAGVIAAGPITLNAAADGTPYIVADLYDVLVFPQRRPLGLPRDAAGRLRLGGWTREKLYMWPLSRDRTGLLRPVLIRDARSDFGPPPGGSTWSIDHPAGATVQLRDGARRHLLGYRVLEYGEFVFQLGPTWHTGAYLDEVISAPIEKHQNGG